jgi:hypothetical protein
MPQLGGYNVEIEPIRVSLLIAAAEAVSWTD